MDSIPGQVHVSESFRRLLSRKRFIYDTFSWQDWNVVNFPSLDIQVKTHIVEQIFAELDSSEELEEGQFMPAVSGDIMGMNQVKFAMDNMERPSRVEEIERDSEHSKGKSKIEGPPQNYE